MLPEVWRAINDVDVETDYWTWQWRAQDISAFSLYLGALRTMSDMWTYLSECTRDVRENCVQRGQKILSFYCSSLEIFLLF